MSRVWKYFFSFLLVVSLLALANAASEPDGEDTAEGSTVDVRAEAVNPENGFVKTYRFEYPMIAVIEVWTPSEYWKPLAQGTIYNPYTVLITGTTQKKIESHIKARTIRVGAGIEEYQKPHENSRQYREVCRVTINVKFDPRGPKYNMAVLHLSDPFVFTRAVNNVHLVKPGTNIQGFCRLALFGKWWENIIYWDVELSKDCDTKDDSIICTKKPYYVAPIDEGAPVICARNSRYFLYGIVSHGIVNNQINYFNFQALDQEWLRKAMEDGRKFCRPYEKFYNYGI